MWRLHDPARPLVLWDVLRYRIRGGVKRAAWASRIPGAPTRTTTRWRVIRVHVRVVTARTRCSGVVVLRPFAFLLANTVYARAWVHRVVDSPI